MSTQIVLGVLHTERSHQRLSLQINVDRLDYRCNLKCVITFVINKNTFK